MKYMLKHSSICKNIRFIKIREDIIMKAILTVIGKDKPGIVAGISDELYKQNINIVDISQKYYRIILL